MVSLFPHAFTHCRNCLALLTLVRGWLPLPSGYVLACLLETQHAPPLPGFRASQSHSLMNRYCVCVYPQHSGFRLKSYYCATEDSLGRWDRWDMSL